MECLVSTKYLPSRSKYCALSYVWGQALSSKLTRRNEAAFCTPGAFSVNNEDIVIPTTVRHAIGLVKTLGEKYLWVDALCIAQDDHECFHGELRNMAAIYDRAYLAIVAATGWNANDGLKGLEGITPRRHPASNFADDLHKYSNTDSMIWVGT
jgi:hypothetical protein